MASFDVLPGCARCAVDRRKFLAAGCAACAGAVGLLAPARPAAGADAAGKARIRIVYSLHAVKQPGPDWPNVGLRFRPVMDRIKAELTKRCPGFEFVTAHGQRSRSRPRRSSTTTRPPAIDGYLVYQMNCWNRVVQTMATSGKPVLYADFQYGGSGGFLVYTAGFLRSKAPNVGFVASSRIEDLAEAVKCFDLVKKGGSPAEFVAATARVRAERTPAAGDLACQPDELQLLSHRRDASAG